MSSGLNSLTTVLDAVSPLIVGYSDETSVTPKTHATLLTPRGATSSALVDKANAFGPPANIDLLAPAASSVLLTEQAREKPVILENFGNRPGASLRPLGNLDVYRDLLDRPAASHRDTPAFRPVHSDTPDRSPQFLKAAFKAFDNAQTLRQSLQQSQPAAEKQAYIGSTVDVTA